ncbi:MAG: OmpA family protein [Candidatus Paceibacterota bacterium]|jgi:outer membrane protein OmpA-like peptidoglycan-associated protein
MTTSTEQVSERKFGPLDDKGWSELKEVATLRVEPINFQNGDNTLSDIGKEQVDNVATMLKNNFPGDRVLIRGHTGPGDEKENLQLSQERADVVAKYLSVAHHIETNRLRGEGVGSKMPIKRKQDESQRAYQYRLPRVEFVLLEDSL